MSRQRNIRTTKLSFDDEEGNDTGGTVPKPKTAPKPSVAGSVLGGKPLSFTSTSAPKPSTAGSGTIGARKDSKPNLLSFEEDGEEGALPGISKKKEKSKPKFGRAQGLPELPAAAPITQRSGAGEYTAERLKELSKNALSFSSSKFAGQSQDGGAGGGGGAGEPMIKLSGSFKPAASAAKDDRFQAQPMVVLPPPEEEAMPLPPPARPAKPEAPAEEEEEEDDGGFIPDEKTIRLAKAKRERLRQAHLAPDYIPLGGAQRLVGAAGAALAEPLTAGEGGAASGSDGEDELEEHMRLKFTVQGEGSRRDRAAYAKTLNVVDEEEDAFASNQLQKAIRRQKDMMAAAGTSGGAAAQGAAAGRRGDVGDLTTSGPAYGLGMTEAKRMERIAAMGADVMAALQEGVKRLGTSHKASQSNLQRTSTNLASSLQKAEQLESDSKAASDKYVYVQQVRSYIADLCDCLSHKSPLVEELEDSLMELREDRAAGKREAVRDFEAEMLRPAEAAVTAAMGVLARGGGAAAATGAAESAAAAAEEELEDRVDDLPVELDEFGRNVNLGRKRELQARSDRRAKVLKRETDRLRAVASAGMSISLEEEDDIGEEPGQISRYEARHREVLEGADTVFADADEEFASLGAVKQRLEEFKARQTKDYRNTYMHLSTPALFAPYVRLELLRWDPLYADSSASSSSGAAEGGASRPEVHKGFDKQPWYEALFDYGLGPDPAAASPDDPDGELVPQLVKKLVLPLAHHMLDKCWDPCDLRQTSAAATMLGDLCVYIPSDEGRMKEVLDTVVQVLEEAVAACSLPPWPPAALAASPLAQAVLFRRFRSACRLLAGLSAFHGLLAPGLLQGLALGKVVGGQLMPYLRGAAADTAVAVARIEAVAGALPADWFAAGAPQEAAPLVDLAAGVARSLESQRGGSTHKALAPLAGRLARVLLRLGADKQGRQLAAAYGVQLQPPATAAAGGR